jgi:hypothetical protein
MRNPVAFSPTLLLLAGLLAATGACAGDDGPVLGESELEEQDVDQVGKAVSASLAQNLGRTDGVTSAAFAAALGIPPAWLRTGEGGLLVGDLFGIHVSMEVTCLDAAGAPMAACSSATNSASVTGEVSGQLSLLGWTGTLDVSVEWQVDGLQEAIARVEGSATIALGSEFRDWLRPVTYQATFTIDASVAVSVRTIDRVPTAGSVSIELDYRRSRSDNGETAHYQFPISVSIADGVAHFTLGGSEIIVDL